MDSNSQPIPNQVIVETLTALAGLIYTALEKNAALTRLVATHLDTLPLNEKEALLSSLSREEMTLQNVKVIFENKLKPYRV